MQTQSEKQVTDIGHEDVKNQNEEIIKKGNLIGFLQLNLIIEF